MDDSVVGGPPPQPLTRSASHHDELDEGGEAVVAPPMLLGRALSLQEAREQADGTWLWAIDQLKLAPPKD